MSTTTRHGIEIPEEELAELCRRYQVRELALFGSALRDDFGPDSDVDVLVEFEPDAPVDLLGFIALRRELAARFGKNVDLTERLALRPMIRDEIVASSRIIYAAG